MKARLIAFSLSLVAVVAAGAAPVVAVICLSSEACPMMAREARRGCHEEGPQDHPSDCCDSTKAAVAQEGALPLLVGPPVVSREVVALAVASPLPSGSHGADLATDQLGPPGSGSGLFALLCTFLI